MFETLSDRLTSVFSSLRGKGRLSEEDINATAREIRLALLEADVALPVVREFIARIKERARGEEVSKALNPAQQVIKIVNEELVGILGGETRQIRFAKNPPTVIMLAGLQGAGKTTLAGKLARWLAADRNTPLLVAADLQRPNAVTQLQVVGERAGTPVFAPEPGNGVGDPVQVARESVEHARRNNHNVVIIDTAGRLGVDSEMMRQAADIRDAVSPDEILFVVDAMIGQDAVNTAQAFLDGVGYDAVALTKLDGDARGGAALSIRHITGRPIMFASTGEKLEDFDLFHPDRMASRILDMGDVLTLIEQAQRTFDEAEVEKMASTMASDEDFTLDDFLQQMQMVRKLGPIGNLLGMMPGMGQMREQIDSIDDKDLDRIQAVIQSMTPGERANPKMINGSRRLRIANGSGTQVSDVNGLVTRFFEAQKMMRKMKSGGMPGMPGMPGMGGGANRKKAKAQAKKAKKGKQRSGNPMKARQQEADRAAERQRRQEEGGQQPPQLPPGLGGGGQPTLPPGFGGPNMPDLSNFKLPKQ
ncbi:signal recognition particle protein [Nocardiopsis dassonvillei]|uniref:signal recognition particle protein n=1 Tax=Nocardiopsis dassonvillei TaxID=2014 RepID=UPI00102B7E84|nr:signal recognition particle protein [Nocardiopsis dassonvillei]MCP3016109.1 signal recognition particle protein [Nocardiopsis dassonvillei]